MSQYSRQQAQIAKINLRLPTVSTILPVSALTSKNNSIYFPVSIGEPNELGQRDLGTPGAEILSSPSFRTLGTFDWHVPCRLLRRDGENSLWNELWRLAHYQRLKPFVISVWGAHYCHQYKSIKVNLWWNQRFEIRLWGDQQFWIASSANATPCHERINGRQKNICFTLYLNFFLINMD